MGLLLSSDNRTACISERTPNARAGRIIACDLRNGQSQALPANLHEPAYLAWLMIPPKRQSMPRKAMPPARAASPGGYASHRGHAAVHEQQGAGDIGGIVGGKEQDRG